MQPKAYYKLIITYEDPDDPGKLLEHGLVLYPPPEIGDDVLKQHAMAKQSVVGIWTGQIPLMTANDYYVHPNLVRAVQIVQNIETAEAIIPTDEIAKAVAS